MTFAQQQALIDYAMRARAQAWAELAASLGRALRLQALRLIRAWQDARARRELHALSDRTLKDIGIGRSEIESLFR